MFIKQYDHQTPTKSGSPQHNIFSQFTPIPQRRFARESIGALIPSPLHLSEDPGSEELPSTPPTSKSAGLLSNIFRNSQGYLPFTPPKNIIPSSPSSSVRRRSITFSASSYQWSQRRSAERYNEHLADFAKMLQGHITTVEELISTVKNFQADRRVKRFASLRDDKETRAADLGARILRLRAKGWKRERFVPEKYQELCAKALAEL